MNKNIGIFKNDQSTHYFTILHQDSSLVRDLLLLVSPRGHLLASYLGTTPSIFAVTPAAAAAGGGRDVNYEETDAEFARLNAKIRAATQPGNEKSEGYSIVLY